jgi:hypothetical protein
MSPRLWVLLFALAGCSPFWAGDVLWDPPVALAALGLGAALGGAFAERARLGRGVLGGAVAGLVVWVACLASWLLGEIALGGRAGFLARLGAGLAGGALFGCLVLQLARRARRRWLEVVRRCLVGALAGALVVSAALYLLYTGPRDPSAYPPAETSPYKLPFPAGRTCLCVQGNRAVVSHRKREEYAYDFAMPVGSDVCAARAGRVVAVVDMHDGNGLRAPNNYVLVDHGDGTTACYAHLRKGGSYVVVNERVEQGQRLGASGNVGMSLLPHLHFHVAGREGTVPVTFRDVEGGIPRMFRRYTSGNARPGDVAFSSASPRHTGASPAAGRKPPRRADTP